MQIVSPQYLLDLVFNLFQCMNGTKIYWRECVLRKDMVHGQQGYFWVFEDGEVLHSYRRPDQCFESAE